TMYVTCSPAFASALTYGAPEDRGWVRPNSASDEEARIPAGRSLRGLIVVPITIHLLPQRSLLLHVEAEPALALARLQVSVDDEIQSELERAGDRLQEEIERDELPLVMADLISPEDRIQGLGGHIHVQGCELVGMNVEERALETSDAH